LPTKPENTADTLSYECGCQGEGHARIREKFLGEILMTYSSDELSAGGATFYRLLAERDGPLPAKLEEGIQV